MTKLYRKISELATLEGVHKKDGRKLKPSNLEIIRDAAIAFNDDQILWVGKDSDIPAEFLSFQEFDLKGKTVIPELVDCHTHIVFGGNRSDEYTMRLNGADYVAIANAGGGILNTMKGTNALSADELFNLAIERVERLNSYGVGTIEIKSGYGLNYGKEKEITLIIDRLKKHFAPKIQILNTYMAAHAVPKDYDSPGQYLDEVVIPLLNELAPQQIIDAVDIFHEKGYFSSKDTTLLFEAAKKLGIAIKSHADEFNDNKGGKLACEYGALSSDHLLCTGEDGIQAFAKSSTVATLLPGTGFFLGKLQANARRFLDAGCKVAIGSDYNPGSCHCDNVLLIASLAAPQYKMNIAELWSAITYNAAHALGLNQQGVIKPGFKPRFSVFDVPTINEITYNWGRNFRTSDFLE